VGIVGATGSGKTTLINLLTGHLAADGGEFRVRGQRVSGHPPHLYAAMGVARTFQLTQLFGRMTVLDSVRFPAGAGRRDSRGRATITVHQGA
jgi:branched-chain amino acid transport system permease protein